MTYAIQHNPLPTVVFSTNSRTAARRWAQAQLGAVVIGVLYGCHQGTVQYLNGRRVDVTRPSAVSDEYIRWLELARGLPDLPVLNIPYNAATRDLISRS